MTDRPTREGPRLSAILPEGITPPPHIPPAIFSSALHAFLELRRVDMRALAADVGMGRSSLYRKARSRDHLLGELLWYMARRTVARAVEEATGLHGSRWVIAVIDRFLHDVHSQPALRRLLQEEPEAALRMLTSKHGAVQQRMIDVVERLLAQEEALETADLSLDRGTLAYVIVRIGESFLYADVIADNQPDVDRAVEVIARLLGTSVPTPR
jgi:AcrR family transcriptional regulator